MTKLDALALHMITYYAADPARIQHFIKVHSFAALIARQEGMDASTLEMLEAAAYVHDIGIKPAEQTYGSSAGKYQEELGPAPARAGSAGEAALIWLRDHADTGTTDAAGATADMSNEEICDALIEVMPTLAVTGLTSAGSAIT